jgi:transcriptional regulator with XRE-family HTH domain
MSDPLSVRALRRIQEEMDREKVNQADIAGMLKWSQSRVSKLLNGKLELTVDALASLCFAVGILPTEAVRDHGMEFCAEMSPTELRFLERLRQLTPDMRDAYMKTMAVHAKTRMEERRAGTEKKLPRGRG